MKSLNNHPHLQTQFTNTEFSPITNHRAGVFSQIATVLVFLVAKVRRKFRLYAVLDTEIAA